MIHHPDCRYSPVRNPDGCSCGLVDTLAELERLRELERTINTPHIAEFLEAVKVEAVHQRARWGVEHDAGKAPEDWFWLLGYLAGKALSAAKAGDVDKCLHHLISSAAALLNQHAHMTGDDTRMRPGIEPPKDV